MGTQRVQMKEVLPWLVRWACRADKGDFYIALSVKNILVLTGQAAVLGRLSLSMCLWFSHPAPIRESYLTFEPTFPELDQAPPPM
jgi:hypothetical protein